MYKPIEFNPMRSLIFVHCPKQKNWHRLQHWMYYHHVPESMAKFGPFVSKYTYYHALPLPETAENFGGRNFVLTEHYWMVNPMDSRAMVNALSEYFPPQALVWQGHLPDQESYEVEMFNGDEARTKKGNKNDGTNPFVYVFLPMWWEEDFKGSGRTLEDGCNYRWIFAIRYPDEITFEEGEKWFHEQFIPAFQEMPETTRILSSQIIREVNDCAYHRVTEIWFEDNEVWLQAMKKANEHLEIPVWAKQKTFPFFEPQEEIVSMFMSDMPGDEHYFQYGGYKPMR